MQTGTNKDIAARILGFVATLLGTGWLALQSPEVQTGLAERAVRKLEAEIPGRIQFGEASIEPMNSFRLKDVIILDGDPYDKDSPVDTFFTARSISGRVSLKSVLSGRGVSLSRLRVDGSMMHLTIEPDTTGLRNGSTNLERIFGIGYTPHENYLDSPDLFEIDKVEFYGFHYRMKDYLRPSEDVPGSMNWSDLDLTADLLAHGLKYTGGRMSGIVDRLSCTERCGYTLQSLSGRARVGMGRAQIDRIHLLDEWSDATVDLYSMGWKHARDYASFSEKIRLEGVIGGGTLNLNTIKAFTGAQLPGLDLELGGGRITGYVNDFTLKHIRMREKDSGIAADLSGTFTGIGDVHSMLADARVHNLTFTTSGVGTLLGEFGVRADLEDIAPGRVFSFSGKAKGPLDRLQTSGSLGSRIGRASFSASLLNLVNSSRPLEARGRLETRNLSLSELLGTDLLGECTAAAGFRASVKEGSAGISVDSLLIDKLGVRGYDYTGMKVTGNWTGKAFEGRVLCGDPNLNFVLEGSADLDAASFRADGNIGYADLNALGFDKRGRSLVSGGVFGVSGGGRTIVNLSGVTVENELGSRNLGDIGIDSYASEGRHTLSVHSGFAEARYEGDRSIPDMLAAIQELTVRRELPSLYRDTRAAEDVSPYCKAAIDLHDTRDLLSYLLPGLYIADSTGVRLDVSRDGSLDARVSSSRIAWKTDYLKGLSLMFDNRDRSLNALIISKETSLGGIGFSNSALTGYATGDTFFAGFSYDGIKGHENLGEIYLTGEFSREQGDSLRITARPLSSFVRFNGEQWDLDESEIVLESGMARVQGLSIHNGDQRITLDGGVSRSRRDTLRLGMQNVDLGVINYFTKGRYDVHGRTGGRAILNSPLGRGFTAIASLSCDSLKVGGVDAGTLRAGAYWDDSRDKVNIIVKNNLQGTEVLDATGTYHPKARRVEMDADLDGINLVIAQPFVSGFLSEISGGMKGTLAASGSLDSLKLSSRGAAIDHARIGIAATGVAYNINGPFRIDNDGIHFDDISVSDDKGGSASLFGGIGIRDLDNIMLGAGLRMRRLELLNLSGSEGLRGNLFANGQIYVSGPPDALLLDADVTTAGEGNLHVPLNSAISASKSDLLSFTSHEVVYKDPYDDVLAQLLEQRRRKVATESGGGDFIARVRVNTTPELQASLELDNTGDNILRFRGDGAIGLNLRPSKDIMEISGDYSINEGNYRFAIPGIVSKDFTIDRGSSITFNGDVMESVLDIGATYTLRTSLNRLLADTTSVSTRRPVNCGIHISDRLAAPSVSFSIDIPDLDPSTKSEVEGALNTEDKIQKQFVALLVTGSFIPNEQSGIVNNPNILYSNVSEIMSQQLSNILSRLEIPLDMGLGYQPSSSGTDLFDLAVRTELFNNRVEVNGSVGNRQSTTGTSTYGDVVGDLDIDIKLDKTGQVRLNLFSHSADEYTAYLDNTQRNGGGITYQKEFNTWREFFRNLFTSRKKREERASQATQAPPIVIKVDE